MMTIEESRENKTNHAKFQWYTNDRMRKRNNRKCLADIGHYSSMVFQDEKPFSKNNWFMQGKSH